MFFFNKNKKTSDKNAEADKTKEAWKQLEEQRRALFQQSLKELEIEA